MLATKLHPMQPETSMPLIQIPKKTQKTGYMETFCSLRKYKRLIAFILELTFSVCALLKKNKTKTLFMTTLQFYKLIHLFLLPENQIF